MSEKGVTKGSQAIELFPIPIQNQPSLKILPKLHSSHQPTPPVQHSPC